MDGGAEVKALLLDGSVGNEMDRSREAMEALLLEEGFEVEVVPLRERDIGGCRGCLRCWVDSPGDCVMTDEASPVMMSFVRSSIIVLLTPVTFGGYSFHLKKILDRTICTVLPYYGRYKGGISHPRRYGTAPSMVFVGLLPRRDSEAQSVFRELTRKNASDLRAVGWSTALIFSNERPEMTYIAIREALVEAGVVV